MFKTTIIIITACLFCSVAQAQQSLVERYNLPQYDCELKNIMEAKKITIIVPNDSTVVWANAKRIKENGARSGIEVTIKTESQLLKNDFDDNLWIMGPIAGYSDWNQFDIPLKKSKRSFTIGKFSFKDPSYGFSYASPPSVSPFRLVTSGNSLNAFERVANMPSFGFEYVVLKDAVPELIGNGSRFADLSELKKSLYTTMESKYYTFMVSKNLNLEDTEKDIAAEIEKYDNHAEAFVKKMELNLPKKKIKTYIHATQEEIKYFSGFFNALCGGTTHGFVSGDEIHSWKWGGAVEHEANHHLFNQQVNKMAPTFLSEGIQKWYEYTVKAEAKGSGFQKAIEFVDEDLADIICGRGDFFQGDKYYLISGIFTDYLIDTYGLNKFKKLYKYETHELLTGFEKTYNKSLSEILGEYKKWLLLKSTKDK